MKNHFMFLQRSFAMLSLLMAALVAYAEFYDDRFKYTVNSDKETVTLHAKSGVTYEGSVIIPSVAYDSDNEKWYDVSVIGASTFKGCVDLTGVDIPLSIKSIGSGAFSGCVQLKDILIPGSVTDIHQSAFYGCSSLETVTLGEGVLNIGTSGSSGVGTFADCKSLTTINIPGSVKTINYSAFKGCSSLEEITLNNGLQTIESSVFTNCTNLQSIVIPNTVTSVGSSCFSGCSSLTSAVIGGGVESMGNSLFSGNKKLAEVTIEDGCRVISNSAFSGCVALKEIHIPGTVETIHQSAFSGCTALETVTMGEGVLNIGTSGNSGSGTFADCVSLKHVTIPSSLLNIYYYAFKGCSALEEITLNNGLQTIWPSVFANCTNLKSIVIPNTVTSVGSGCFSGCSSLTSAVIGGGVESMGNSLFSGNKKLAEVTIEDGCRVISNSAFSGCVALNNIHIPGSVEIVHQSAFNGCTALETVTMGEGVLKIGTSGNSGSGTFQGCTQLWKIELPSTIKNIYYQSFKDCTNLRRVTCKATLLPSMDTNVWKNSAQAKATLYVPESALADYQASAQWNGFKNVWPIGTTTGGEDIYGDCDLQDVASNSIYFDAAAFLCDRTVLSGSKVNGMVAIDDTITRAQLAKVAFRGLYLLQGVEYPTYLASDYYPTVYQDLNTLTVDNEYYYQAARALLYLDYGDGVTPFDRNRLSFNPEGKIERIHVLKVLMETFDIQPDVTNTNNPFPNDEWSKHLLTNQPRKFGYIRKAAKLGIINTGNDEFRPYDYCTRGDAFLMLYRIMQKIEAGTITMPVPTEVAYFEPLNLTLKNLANGLGVEMGNFNHYTKSSFNIDGLVPLTFAFTYNSYHTAIDDVFFGQRRLENTDVTYRPLTAGWSHSYDCYITLVGEGDDQRAIIHWGDGSIHVYKKSGSDYEPESVGVYDNLTIGGGMATVKTKGQVTYKFEQLEGEGTTLYYITSVTDRNDNRLTINYVDGQRGMKVVSSVSDGIRQLNFTYKDGTNLLASVSDPMQRTIKFTYTYNKSTDEYQLTSFTDAKGNITKYTYGNSSRVSTARLLARVQLPKGNYVENEYDQNRRLNQTVVGQNNTPKTKTSVSVLADYQNSVATHSTITVERDESVSSTTNFQMNENNMAVNVDGDEGFNATYTYGDERHPQLPTKINSNNTVIDEIKYDDKGNLTSITIAANDGGGRLTSTYTYDSMNNLTSATDAMGNKTTYSYDSHGNLVKVTMPEGVTTNYVVDGQGLVTSAINPMGVETKFAYNGFGNLTGTTLSALSLTSTAEYDAASRVTAVIDPLSRKTSYTYDNNDNVLQETDANGKTTKYGYDANENLTSVTNVAGNTTTLTYDKTTDWLLSVAFGGSTKSYEYNKDGTVKTYVKPDGTRLDRSYDKLGRVTFDGLNRYEYDDKMHLQSVQSDKNKLTFAYDGFNRATAVDFTQGNIQSTVRYQYDDNSNVTAITYPDGSTANYTYDALNRLTQVSAWSGIKVKYTYRKDSQLERVDYSNGMTTIYGYDVVGRLVSKKTTLGNGTVVADYSFTLDNVGNITEQSYTEPCGDKPMTEEAITYTYNKANRITKAGDISFTFDANGNTSQRDSEQYLWDVFDRMAKIGTTSLTYNPMGQIVAYDDINFTIDPLGRGNVLSDSKSGAQYVYGNGLEARVINGKLSYYVTDVRGSVVAIVDDNGNVTHKYQYDEFGNVIQKQEADFNPFQYVGLHGVMALNDHQYYMRARHYDPTIGRFYSEDPIWSTNLYPYADNNPIMGIDPSGLKPTYNEALAMASNVYDSPAEGTMVGQWKVVESYSNMLTGLQFSLYNKGSKYVLAFAGTTWYSIPDWFNNFCQAAGVESFQYDDAIVVGRYLKNAVGAENVTFVGHSLGGGLASAASRATGCDAITFNAAALHETYDWKVESNIDAYITTSDELNKAQSLIKQHAAGTTHEVPNGCPRFNHSIGCFPMQRR